MSTYKSYFNPPPKNYDVLKLLVAFVAMIILVILFSSCNPERKIQRATMTVLTTPSAFDSVGRVWANLNPCGKQDTLIEFIQGDSIVTERRDTLIESKIINDTVHHFVEVTKMVRKTDTVRIQLPPDTRALRLTFEQINDLKARLSVSISQTESSKGETNKREKWLLWAVIGGILGGVIIGVLIKSKLL